MLPITASIPLRPPTERQVAMPNVLSAKRAWATMPVQGGHRIKPFRILFNFMFLQSLRPRSRPGANQRAIPGRCEYLGEALRNDAMLTGPPESRLISSS
jgi:hypothetical protein